MHFIQAIILGLIQGLTEFIPVSSSGHLLFVEKQFGLGIGGLAFDVALHWGTLVALIIFFWKDWISIITSFIRHIASGKSYSKDSKSTDKLLVPIIIASIPVAIAGAKLGDSIDGLRDKSWILPTVAVVLVIFALVMLLAEKVSKKQREMGTLNYADYLIIGIAQVLALFPGVSRSGITISAGLFRNINRETAARFSFLLSTPAVLGAGLKMLWDIHKTGLAAGEKSIFIVGFITAAISGYLTIKFLMNYLQRGSLKVFAVYRIILAAVIIAAFLWA